MGASGSAEEWDVVVPADGDELLAELRRHGIRPGQRVHLSMIDENDSAATEELPDYVGSFASGQPDLAERSAEILRREFPGR